MKKLILNQLISRKEQTGQAMVEYAILLTVMITLIAGGVEIGLAAFNSNRTAEAAKAGATEWLKRGLRYAQDDGAGNIVLSREIDVAGTTVIYDRWGIGDHDASITATNSGVGIFNNPTCNPSGFNIDGTGHDSGLPSDASPEDERHPDFDLATRNRIYLYNPLPIDITECVNVDTGKPDFFGFASAVEVDTDADDVTDYIVHYLPPANRALLSLYVKECFDSASKVIDCTSDSKDKIFLRLPAGPHIQQTSAPGVVGMTKLGIFVEDGDVMKLDTASGQSSDPGFLDTFRMHCSLPGIPFSNPLEEDNCMNVCYDASTGQGLACDVRIIIRYRHVFESLVMMMGWKSPVNNLPQDREATDHPFVDDNSPTELARGVLGTEVTRGFVLKPQKTFRGCNETTSVINKTVSGGANSIEVRTCN